MKRKNITTTAKGLMCGLVCREDKSWPPGLYHPEEVGGVIEC